MRPETVSSGAAIGAILIASQLVATSVLGDPPPSGTEARVVTPRTYGTANRTVLTVPAWDFVPRLSSAITAVDAQFTSRCMDASSPDFNLRAGLQLPNGALLERIVLEGCDYTNSDQITLAVAQCAIPSGACLTAAVISGDAFNGGCDMFAGNLTSPIEIDNTNNTYYFEVQLPPGCNLGTFRSARASYRLRVSPAPVTATFDDVPVGHPQRQYIEALVAAGITAGCGTSPPRYCPDAQLTRGQVAVFLAKALGLHWSP